MVKKVHKVVLVLGLFVTGYYYAVEKVFVLVEMLREYMRIMFWI